MYDTTLYKKTPKQQARIILSRFESGDTEMGIRFSIGGLYLRDFITCVSCEALAYIKEFKPEWLKNGVLKRRGGYSGLIIEHTIPVNVTYSHFKKLYAGGKLTEDYIERLIKSGRLMCALVTKKENDTKFNKALKDKCPPEWDFEKGDPLARYNAAAIETVQLAVATRG